MYEESVLCKLYDFATQWNLRQDILIPNKKLSNKKGQLESDVLSLNSRVDPKKVLPYRIFTTFQPF